MQDPVAGARLQDRRCLSDIHNANVT
jgi:hypothetical protein